MQQDFLPPEFETIAHLVHYVHRKSANEYSSSCPQCGGQVHKNGSDPDRFVMFVIGKYGFPLGFCRKCGYRWTPKKGKEPSKEEVEEWRKRQIEVEQARIEISKRTIELLQSDKAWELFFHKNNEWSRETFTGWGISQTWQDYLKLGLVEDYIVKSGEESYHSPAFSIPVWFTGGVVQNIQLRVANPRQPRDRYRNFYSMGQSFLFVPLYDLPLQGTCVLVEGYKKAIVMEQTLDDINFRVVGISGMTPDPNLFKHLSEFERIFVWLDPDAKVSQIDKQGKPKETPLEYVIRMVGKERARIVDCPVKSDDGIVQNGIDPRKYLNLAMKA